MTVVVLQAGAAQRVWATRPEAAHAALEAITTMARDTLAVLRESLREEAPARLAALDELVARVRPLGLDVTVGRDPVVLPPALDHIAFCVVQEALTNAVRHAAPTAVRVSIVRDRAVLRVEIADGGALRERARGGRRGDGHRAARDGGAGRGLRRGARPRAGRCGLPRLGAAAAGGGPRVSARILVADDQDLVRAGLRMLIDAEHDLEVVGEAVDGEQALHAVRRLRPDLVLMDIRMPRLDGLEATRRLLRDGAGAPRVLILTTFDRNEYVYDALRAGASGFMLKDMPGPQLVAGLRAVAGGDALLAPTVTRRLIEEFAGARHAPVPDGFAELTARERETFMLVARGLSNAEIAAEHVVSEATVKTHVAHVLAKLDLRDRVQAVVLAYETGSSDRVCEAA